MQRGKVNVCEMYKFHCGNCMYVLMLKYHQISEMQAESRVYMCVDACECVASHVFAEQGHLIP